MARKVRELTYRQVLELARKLRTFPELQLRALPPRGPVGSEVNRVRRRVQVRCLIAWSNLGRGGA